MIAARTPPHAGALEVPVIDLAPFRRGERGALERTARRIGEASASIGVYLIGGHGVPEALVARAFAEAARFHALPLERKLEVKVTDQVVGYLPQGGQTQRTSPYGTSPHPDASASYYIRQDWPADHPDAIAGKPWVFANKWIGGLPGFKETMLDYFAAMSRLAGDLLTLQSVALDLGPNYLRRHEAFSPPLYNLRLLHYPPRDQTLDGQFGIGPHTDYGYLTILAQGQVPGLEILADDGRWIEAPVLDGHFLVNNSDMCRVWTNDRFRSAPHRVIIKTCVERYAIPFFIAPRPDVVLDCLPTCRGAGPKYAPLSYGDYIRTVSRKNFDFLAGTP